MTRLGAWVLLLIGSLLGGCTSVRLHPAGATLPTAAGVTLPSHRCATYFLVDATVNGHGPFSFILDTGAGATVVSSRLAGILSESTRRANLTARGAQNRSQHVDRIVEIRELVIGEARFSEFDAIELDLTDLQLSIGERFDGILGYAVFKGLLLSIDYPRSLVSVSIGELPPADNLRIFELHGEDLPAVDLRLGDRTRRFVLDTGKSRAFSVRDLDGVRLVNPAVTIARGNAVGGRFSTRAGRLASDIVLGELVYPLPIVDETAGVDLVGAEAFKAYTLVFDQRQSRVGFFGSDGPSLRAEPVRGVGMGLDRGAEWWDVHEVTAGLPAEQAGIRAGDRVLRLGGRTPSELACTDTRELYRSAEFILVTVARGTGEVDLSVPIVTLIP